MGWRGGCLAAGLVPSTVCYYCLGGCSALVVCARRAGQVSGVGAGAGSRLSLPSRPSRCMLWGVPSGCPFPSPAGMPFGPVALRVCAACLLRVCALLLPLRTHLFPPPGRYGARTTRGSGAGRR